MDVCGLSKNRMRASIIPVACKRKSCLLRAAAEGIYRCAKTIKRKERTHEENDLQSFTSRIVAEHLADGFRLEWDNASYGQMQSVYWLSKNETRLFLGVKECYGYGDADCLEVYLFEVESTASFVHEEEHEPIAVFYKLSEDWFTSDKTAADTAVEKRLERYRRRHFQTEDIELEPSEPVVAVFKQIFGVEKMAKKNLCIKSTRAQCLTRRGITQTQQYTVELLNRLGNVKQTKSYRLGQ